ncbi:hypothetical protein ACJX0J_041297, partial [Zea mays]
RATSHRSEEPEKKDGNFRVTRRDRHIISIIEVEAREKILGFTSKKQIFFAGFFGGGYGLHRLHRNGNATDRSLGIREGGILPEAGSVIEQGAKFYGTPIQHYIFCKWEPITIANLISNPSETEVQNP